MERHISYEVLTKCRTINDVAEFCIKNKIQQILSVDSGNKKAEAVSDNDIAVISVACSFLDADTPEEYWNNILQGRYLIDEVVAECWDSFKVLYSQKLR